MTHTLRASALSHVTSHKRAEGQPHPQGSWDPQARALPQAHLCGLTADRLGQVWGELI